MDPRDSARASLWGRTYRAALGRDPRVLLEEEAAADASRLEATTNPATDIEAARVLGWYRWLRYLAVPDDDASNELAGALAMLRRVFQSNPYAVPRPLQPWYLQEEADSHAMQRGQAESQAGNRPAVAENDAGRLPVFHSAVQATVGSAPASQEERTRFLLDAALMLRSIAGRSADPAVLAEVADLTLAALGDSRVGLPQRGDLRSLGTPQPFLESMPEGRSSPAAGAALAPGRAPAALGRPAGLAPAGLPPAPAGLAAAPAGLHAPDAEHDSAPGHDFSGYSSGNHHSSGREAADEGFDYVNIFDLDHGFDYYDGPDHGDVPDYRDTGYRSGGYGASGYASGDYADNGYEASDSGAASYTSGDAAGYRSDGYTSGGPGSHGYTSRPSRPGRYRPGGYESSGSRAAGYTSGDPAGYRSDGYTSGPGSHGYASRASGPGGYRSDGYGSGGSGAGAYGIRGSNSGAAGDRAAAGDFRSRQGDSPPDTHSPSSQQAPIPAPGGRAGYTGPLETGGRVAQGGAGSEGFFQAGPRDPLIPGGAEPPQWHLWAQLPERAGVGQRIPLLVWISTTGKPGASVPLRPFRAPGIIISVSAPGFELGTDSDQELTVPGDGESDPVRFGLRAVTPGLHKVRADAFAGGTFLGRIELQISVEAGAALTEGAPRLADLAGVEARPGEVTLQVNMERDSGTYSFQLIGASWYPRVLKQSLAADPTDVVERILAELRAMASKEAGFSSPRAIREHMKNLGTKLWSDIVPDAVRRQFWEQAGNISSFVVMSDLGMVPWELLHVVDHGQPEMGFLAERVPVMRRVYERAPVYSLAFPTSAYVVPPDSPSDALDEVGDVRAVVGSRAHDLGIVTQLDALYEFFSAPPGLLHFACHNKFSPSTGSVVWMDGGPVRPDDLEQAKRKLAMAATNPLIFFNACRTAGEIPGFTEMSGWASQFMAAGAGAFVGTLWPVRSKAARTFATSFYDALIRNATLGEASVQARKSVAEDLEDPTWLAYSVYGSPSARVRA